MIENDRIITCDWEAHGGVLEYDISYLHPDLGVLVQSYWISSVTDEGNLFQSSFSLFGTDAKLESSFSYVPREIKNKIWEVVFGIKRKFFTEHQPDIVEHFIDQAHSVEKRYELYKNSLVLPNYDVAKTKHTIVYQRNKTPTGNGGSFILYSLNYAAYPGRRVSTNQIGSRLARLTAAGARQTLAARRSPTPPAESGGAGG